ncbi:DNA damage-responsive transcriptional repressor RPH1 [Tolypocladium capitatum]|uniref:[histone H3]-trimethyl-L-lysine(9) demethylase n=1 Tax=Tolypocladium capitatum TaxID=45235 RepID=A0A2K3QKB9_9HYPO|nr:DNA damage-responsive transcriptional repressor RPH1 [Tolypocladium capitatum]
MSTDTLRAPAPVDAEPGIGPGPGPEAVLAAAHDAADPGGQIECAKQPAPVFLHSPPDSNNAAKTDASDSELSDLEDEPVLDDLPPAAAEPRDEQQPPQQQEEEEDIGEVLPDHWSGAVPVFRPTMYQFKDFQRFMKKVDSYGMKSGIVKIIPPQEWKDAQPKLDELVKPIKVREPIKQDIMGSNGTYRQVNILHGRSYNLPQWRQLCEQSEHQPPARRGERRANADKQKPPRRPAAASKTAKPSTPTKRGKGRPARGKGQQAQNEEDDRPMTPVSPKVEPQHAEDKPVDSIEKDPGEETDGNDGQPSVGRMGGARQSKPKTQSVSARRKYSRREGSAMIDEAAFKNFDYQMDVSEYTPERCEELERSYWKTLTYAPPLYGADMMGTLFDDRTETWNLNKLPNLLDVLGTKVPGVNTAYLYLGMWKATFAWHLEDVDLYSINYLHFGAPKQWYSISQADARRFEAAMKSVWPADAKACNQFLRHKGFLISPHHLLQHYGIKVNKVVSYPGEFVVTYPYGYHSGYNLGYNCAEAVNFALDSWLEMGKIAKKCECAQAQDSVWINVYEIERKLRGEETEYEETEDDEDEDDDEDMSGLPTPPAGHGVRFKDASRKRKRGVAKGGKAKVKKIKLRLKSKAEPPCCLCPHDISELGMLPTDDGRKAHRLCALYLPETYIDNVDGDEVVCNVAGIHKDRLDLRCLFCRSKRGACFQCSYKKCARAYHATCAAAAGVFVEDQDVPVFGEDGTEFKEQAFEFTCRFHRTKRDKKFDGESLEADSRIRTAAELLQKGETCQFQYYKGEIFAGMVVENRTDEQTLLVDIIPNGYVTSGQRPGLRLTINSDHIEVEWKWLLLPDPADYRLPKASAKAIPMPASRKAQEQLNAKRLQDDKPRKDDPFADGYTWAEFQVEAVTNKDQTKVDFAKPDQVWHYLGKTSTEARAQYTEDPTKQRHNPKGNFLDTLPKPPKPAPTLKAAAYGQQAFGIAGGCTYSYNANSTLAGTGAGTGAGRPAKPYVYKPRKPIEAHPSTPLMSTPQRFIPTASPSPSSPSPAMPHQNYYHPAVGYQNYGVYSTKRFEHMGHSQQARPPAPVASQHYDGSQNIQGPVPQPAAGWQRSSPSPYQKPGGVSQQSRPAWQVHSSVYQKYPFFQVNHNRDSTKYRTPYAAWGGFTNGYEGDLRAHLMSKQSDLLRRSSQSSMSPSPSQMANAFGSPNRQYGTQFRGSGMPSLPPLAPQTYISAASPEHQKTSMTSPPVPEASDQQLHPAINPQYGSMQQCAQPVQQPLLQITRPRPTPAPKPYKVPPKQSPVPLPANFLAAIGSSPSTTTAESRQSSAQPTGPLATPSNVESGNESAQAPQHAQPGAVSTAGQEAPLAHAVRHSTTPVPISRFSGCSPPPAASHGPAPQPETAFSTETMPIVVTADDHGPEPSSVCYNEHGNNAQPPSAQTSSAVNCPQEFADVPGCESMEFVERMMENLKRASRRDAANGYA